jgi:hypothetical protein
MKLIGVTGRARCGKNAFAAKMRKVHGGQVEYSFAQPIYDMLEVFLGGNLPMIDGEYDKTTPIDPYGKTLRLMLQTLGTEWGREIIHPDIWTIKAAEFFIGVPSATDRILVTDVRFDNEARFIHSMGGIVVNVVREDREQIDNHTHRSEDGVSDSLIDIEVNNNRNLCYLQAIAFHVYRNFSKIRAERERVDVA